MERGAKAVSEGNEGRSIAERDGDVCTGNGRELCCETGAQGVEETAFGVAVAAENDALAVLGEG